MAENSSDPVNQHSVPQLILRNFTFGKKEQVYTFDKHTGRIFPTHIRNATGERKFNAYVDGETTVSIEAQLERLEGHCTPIIRQILDNESISGLSVEERAAISLFVAVQYTRTNYQRNLLKQINQDIATAIRKMGGDPHNADGFSPLKDKNDLKRHAIQNILRADQLVEYLIDKTWLLLKTSHSDPFYISDHPVTLQNYLERSGKGNLGLAVEGIEIYMPLSSTLTLAILCPIYEREIREAYAIYEKAKTIAEYCGLPPVLAPHEFAPGLEKLMEGINTGKAMVCSKENVMNLNYLQVVYSSRFVYSSTNDFSLAKDIVEGTANTEVIAPQ